MASVDFYLRFKAAAGMLVHPGNMDIQNFKVVYILHVHCRKCVFQQWR